MTPHGSPSPAPRRPERRRPDSAGTEQPPARKRRRPAEPRPPDAELPIARDSVEPAGEDGRTPLHYAALDDDTDGLLALLAAGAEIDAADVDGAVALHCAAHNGALGALLVLLGAAPLVDAADRNGNTPLMIAVTAGNGDTQLAAALLEAGADPARVNHFKRSPADMADLLGHRALHRLLEP